MSLIKEPVSKRLFDLILSVFGLLVSSPLWIIISLSIYIFDGWPVLFSQERCGKQGRVFTIIKFRTMINPVKSNSVHRVIDLDDDFRITRTGKFIRVTAMDELPVLINILKGDMSFVGPKPLPYLIEDNDAVRYKNIAQVPGYEIRSKVRPGLTGIAQVYAPKNTDHRSKFRYDSLYVQKMSFCLDIKIILASFWTTFSAGWEDKSI